VEIFNRHMRSWIPRKINLTMHEICEHSGVLDHTSCAGSFGGAAASGLSEREHQQRGEPRQTSAAMAAHRSFTCP